jgi:hypothetical protein
MVKGKLTQICKYWNGKDFILYYVTHQTQTSERAKLQNLELIITGYENKIDVALQTSQAATRNEFGIFQVHKQS